MHENSYTIRKMTLQEINIAIDWAAAEGWNPGLHDADCFYAADPNGFLIGLLGDEPIAMVSAVKYGDNFGFLGFYIVKPEYRGMKYGIQIGSAGLAYLKGRTIGLDGVVAQQENYMRAGFTIAYKNIRYQGTADGYKPADSGIVRLSEIPFVDLCSYDKPFFPGNRIEFLRCWINQPQSTALGILQNGKLAGYGVMRICRSGYKIGPLFADNSEFAENLFLALKAHAPEGATIFIDMPIVNSEAVNLANRHNMTAAFETARMYLGKSPDLPIDKIFGITSFELG